MPNQSVTCITTAAPAAKKTIPKAAIANIELRNSTEGTSMARSIAVTITTAARLMNVTTLAAKNIECARLLSIDLALLQFFNRQFQVRINADLPGDRQALLRNLSRAHLRVLHQRAR